MLIVTIFIYNKSMELLLDNEDENLKTAVAQATFSMDNQLNIYNNLSDYIVYNQTIADIIGTDYENSFDRYQAYTTELDPLLSSLKYFQNKVKRITVYTGEDTIEHDTTLAPITEIEDESWFQVVKTSQDINWMIYPKKKEAFSARLMPMLGTKGKLGILYLQVDYDDLFRSFQSMEGGNYGFVVQDEDGDIIYSYTKFNEDNEDAELTGEELKKISSNEKYSVVRAKSQRAEWSVLLYKPREELKSRVQSMLMVPGLIVICFIVLSLALATIVSRGMTRGIEQLTRNMRDIENGKMEITVTSDARDEVGELIRGFGSMISRIQMLINEVYEGQIQRQKAEMKALQAQINPHFLYNFLSLINWKALEAGQEDISKMSLALSTFYRTALNRGKNTLPVREEISNVRAYLDIQRMMHDNSFQVVYEIDDAILDVEMLNLVLQPIVENAIEHGIDLIPEGGGTIQIRGDRDEKDVYLEVIDDGVGMSQEQVDEILTSKSKGYGMNNVNKRLVIEYGEAYSIIIRSEINKGTSVLVKIPVEKSKNA